MKHVMIDGTELVGWLRGQQSTLYYGHPAKIEYEKIVIHIVEMMRRKNGETES